MSPSEISAVLVTKGDRDISEVLESLKDFHGVIVWDNSKRTDHKVFGRYLGCLEAKSEVVYVQDDDTIVDVEALCKLWEPGRIICNMPRRFHNGYDGTGISLVGFGALFERQLLCWGPWADYDAKYPRDEVFFRECDRWFTYVYRDLCVWVDVPIKQLPCSSGPGSMYLEGRTQWDYAEIRRRLAQL